MKDLDHVMDVSVSAAVAGASVFASWEDVAGVRHDEQLIQRDKGEVARKRFFPAEIVPHLQHDLVLGLDDATRRYLEAQHLFQWLLFTVKFELRVVNRSTLEIADGQVAFQVNKAQQRDAMLILVDEHYHAQYSLDVADQLQDISGIQALPLDFQTYLTQLDAVASETGINSSWAQFCQVAIFETLITSLLTAVPDDDSLISVVRSTVRNHVADEVRHHAYFSLLFSAFWQQLTAHEQVAVAKALPKLVMRSLRPNTESAAAALREVGLSHDAVDSVLSDAYADHKVRASTREASRKTMAMFARAGVFHTPGAVEAFRAEGFAVSNGRAGSRTARS